MSQNNAKLRIFSTFTGIGGFEKGIEEALGRDRVEFVGYSEILPSAIAVYRHHWPEHRNYGDITKIDAKSLPDFDLIVGGFPCQSFSCAGARRGFEDTRGTLFFDVARIVKEKRPGVVMLENVKGLLYHDKGNTFKTIVGALDELGYDVQWCVFNSKYFGVPQNRNRIYIVGHLRGQTRPKIYDSLKELREIEKENRERVCGSTLTASGAGHWAKTGSNVVASTLMAQIHGTPDRMLGANLVEEAPGFRNLTPVECERLQGFPDGWTAKGLFQKGDMVWTGEININSAGQRAPHMVFAQGDTASDLLDSERYKLCGNAVTTNVVRHVITQIYGTR